MAKFCTECGKEIEIGEAFCTECGAKAPTEPEVNVAEATAPAVEAVEETPVHTPPPPPTYQTQQTYQPPVQTVSAPALPDRTNKVVGTGTYFWLMVLFAIPIVGFIACIIISFAPKNRNLKNYARAMLIWAIIGLVIAGLLTALFYLLANPLTDYINQLSGNFEGVGETFSQLNELGNMTEQLQNGGLGGLPVQ